MYRFCGACKFARTLMRWLLVQPLFSIRRVVAWRKPPSFLPLMMIDPLRNNFHIIFFIFVGNVKTYGSLQLTARRYAPRQNYLLCNATYLLQLHFVSLTGIIKGSFFFLLQRVSESLSPDYCRLTLLFLQIMRLATN